MRNIVKLKLVLFTIFMFLGLLGKSQEKVLHLSTGKDAMDRKQYNIAVYYFDKAIQEDSLYIEAYVERAHAYNMLGKIDESIKDCNFVLNNDPENASVYFTLGTISFTWLDDNYKAIEYYSKAIEYSLKKDDNMLAGSAYYMRAHIKRKLGDDKGHVEDLEKGAKIGNQICKEALRLYKQVYN